MNFKSYLEEYKKKYVQILFTPETNKKLKEYCDKNNLNISVNYDGDKISNFKFHATIICTENKLVYQNINIDLPGIKFIPDKIEKLGDRATVVVMKQNPKIDEIYKFFKDNGFKSKYNELLLHVSVSYDKEEKRTDIPLPDFDIISQALIIKDDTP